MVMKKSTKDKYSSVLIRLYKSGLTVDDVLKLSDNDLKHAIGFKGKNIDAFRRNVKALTKTDTRIQVILKDVEKKFIKDGYRGKGLKRVQKDLESTIRPSIPEPSALTEKQKEYAIFQDIDEFIKQQQELKKYEYGQIEIRTKTDTYYLRYNKDTNIKDALSGLADSVDLSDATYSNIVFPYTEYIDSNFQESLNEWLGL